MASVYRAHHLDGGPDVALKILRAREVERTQRHGAMLRREYHTLSELVHPRIIEVYDFGELDGVPYYTMELLDGSDLTDATAIPWREACGLIRDVASSLAIIHSRGLVHRDVSTRNVRRTADGRAKLLDFGAMQPMGTVKNVVGTPPFMAPEAVLMQALDGRVDLFSLGALAYYLLTGRHAFQAARISELRDVWRSRPIAPSRLSSEIPRPLSDLVLQLLALDRAGRPGSAAEVFGRLSAVGQLPHEGEADHISRAYLTTPAMVGRQTELVALRRTVLCFVRKVGGSLLIRGPSGVGRSRMLDTCAMEAKLLGASVVRADANDATSKPWGVARRITERLYDTAPRTSARAAKLNADLLAHVVPQLAADAGMPLAADMPVRSQLIRALRDFVLEVGTRGKFAILVDDVDLIDEPSAALLVALAHKAVRCPLLLVATADTERLAQAAAPVLMLEKASDHLDLEPLSQQQNERLVASVFGGASETHPVVQRIASAAQGSPGATMTYAQFLVDRGLARFERGSWVLPSRLAADQLPRSMSHALLSRLQGVDQDARELASALALAEEDALRLPDLPALTEHADTARVFRAIDQLVAARVLVADNDRYSFSQRPLAAVLRAELPEQRRRELSARIAAVLPGRDPIRRVLHLLNAGDDHGALSVISDLDLEVLLPDLGLLERVLAAAESTAAPAAMQHRLRMAVLGKASLVGGSPRFKAVAQRVLGQIEQDCGLAAYAELEHLEAEERLQTALTVAAERYEATAPEQRVCNVVEATRQLARLSGVFTSMASTSLDLELLDSLPDIRPLSPLSPAISCVADIIEIGRMWIEGYRQPCMAKCRKVLARIAEDDRAGLDEVQYQRTFLGLNYTVGIMEALVGSPLAEKHAAILEGDADMRANAWLVRSLMHLYQGNVEESRKCQRRSALMRLQQRAGGRYLDVSSSLFLLGHAALGDQLAIRDMMEMIEYQAGRHAGWRMTRGLARSIHQRLSGDPRGAIKELEPLLAELRENPTPRLYAAGATLVDAMVDAGEHEEAARTARALLQRCEERSVADDSQMLHRAAAHAFYRAGHLAEATEVLDAALAAARTRGMAGLALGSLLELRARIALAAEDPKGFRRFVEQCAREYDHAQNPRLGVRLASLMEESKQASSPRPNVPREIGVSDHHSSELHSRMLECVDMADRSRTALTLLLQSIDSEEGCLYGVSGAGEVTLLASMPPTWTSEGLEGALREYLVVERALLASGSLCATQEIEAPAEEADTQTEEPPLPHMMLESSGFIADEDGRQLEPFAMVAPGEPQRIAAVLLRPVDESSFTRPSALLLSQVAQELMARKDVDGWPLDVGA